MAKLPERNQRLTERSNVRTCWVCGDEIDGDLDEWTWFHGKPAHESCAYEEETR